MAIAAVPRISAQSRVVSYDTMLQARANIRDIYTLKSGLYNRKNESFPEDSIKMMVKDQTVSEGRVTLLENLRVAGVYGNVAAAGTEEVPRTRDLATYQNNYRKVIPKPGYGLRKLETDHYQLYERFEEKIGTWNKEEHGYQIRKSIVRRFGPNLLQGDTAAVAIPWWHPNIFLPALGLHNQPAFSTNQATHTNNIVAGLIAAGGLGQFRARTVTATLMEDLSNWSLNPRRLLPLKISGLPTGEGFVLSVSELQAGFLSNPTYAANNMGSQWISYSRLPEPLIKWPGVIGSYGNILVICDERAPTVLPSGSAAPFSLVDGYMLWDSRDARHRTQPNVKDVGVLHGRGTFIEVEGEPLHWITDDRDYKFHLGLGTAGVRGDQRPDWLIRNATTNAITDAFNQSSALVLLDIPNGGAQSSLGDIP